MKKVSPVTPAVAPTDDSKSIDLTLTGRPSLNAITRPELLELYKIAVDEYRFQTRLNWDRTQFYLLLNSGLISAGIALSNVAKGSILVAVYFLVGIAISRAARLAFRKGEEYYRAIVYKKTLIEALLGRFSPIDGNEHCSLALSTTKGMREVEKKLADPNDYLNAKQMRSGTIKKVIDNLFALFAVIHFVGVLAACWYSVGATGRELVGDFIRSLWL